MPAMARCHATRVTGTGTAAAGKRARTNMEEAERRGWIVKARKKPIQAREPRSAWSRLRKATGKSCRTEGPTGAATDTDTDVWSRRVCRHPICIYISASTNPHLRQRVSWAAS